MILLLQVGNHIQHRVHIIRRRRHGQASQRPGAAVNQTILHRQFQIQAAEMERNTRRRNFVTRRETRVERSQRRERTTHLLPKLVPNRRVDRWDEPGYYGSRVDYGSSSSVRVECEMLGLNRDEDPADADSCQVDVVERRPVGVLQKRGGSDCLWLADRAEFEWTGEVVGFETGKAVGE